jgi:hypothetical protein
MSRNATFVHGQTDRSASPYMIPHLERMQEEYDALRFQLRSEQQNASAHFLLADEKWALFSAKWIPFFCLSSLKINQPTCNVPDSDCVVKASVSDYLHLVGSHVFQDGGVRCERR